MMNNELINIIIVDDHPMVIEGLRSLLVDQEDMRILNTFTRGSEVIDFLAEQACDVILLDISLPDISGTELCRRIIESNPKVKILGMSTYSEASIIHQMIQYGAKGYLLKNASMDELVRAIFLVHGGDMYFSPEVQKILAEFSIKDKPKLTRREREVLELIAAGITTQQIADKLFVSPLTIETHRRNLMQKFGANNAPAMIRAAIEQRLL